MEEGGEDELEEDNFDRQESQKESHHSNYSNDSSKTLKRNMGIALAIKYELQNETTLEQ